MPILPNVLSSKERDEVLRGLLSPTQVKVVRKVAKILCTFYDRSELLLVLEYLTLEFNYEKLCETFYDDIEKPKEAPIVVLVTGDVSNSIINIKSSGNVTNSSVTEDVPMHFPARAVG